MKRLPGEIFKSGNRLYVQPLSLTRIDWQLMRSIAFWRAVCRLCWIAVAVELAILILATII